MKALLWVVGGLAALPLAILLVYLTIGMTGYYLYFLASILGGGA